MKTSRNKNNPSYALLMVFILIYSTFPLLISTHNCNLNFHVEDSPNHEKSQILKNPYASAINKWVVNGIPVINESTDEGGYMMCEDGDDGIIITYHTGSPLYEPRVQRIDIYGSFLWGSTGIGLCNVSTALSPQIISDGSGGAIIAWVDDRDYGSTGFDIYAQRVDSNGNILWTPNGIAVTNASYHQDELQMVSDENGGAIIAWDDLRLSPTNEEDIVAQRIDSDGNKVWGSFPDGRTQCGATSKQELKDMIADGEGGAILVFHDSRNLVTTNADIYAQKIWGSNGNTLWGVDGRPVVTADFVQRDPKLISDNAGGAIFVWVDHRNETTNGHDIYAQRISGAITWDVDGIPVSNFTENQDDHCICPNGKGGAYISWEDSRTGVDKIYFQNISIDGITSLEDNGTVIYDKAVTQEQHEIAEDSNNGFYIAWTEVRSGKRDIYAQHFDENLNDLWSYNGSIICSAEDNQWFPLVFPSLQDGLFIAWRDNRASNNDIFASYIDSIPIASSQNDLVTTRWDGIDFVSLLIEDDSYGGYYRVFVNHSLFLDWESYSSNVSTFIPIDYSYPGHLLYNIEFYEGETEYYGKNYSIRFELLDLNPVIQPPSELDAVYGELSFIYWNIIDDFGGDMYRIILDDENGTRFWIGWTPWFNNTAIHCPIQNLYPGLYNFTIEFNTISTEGHFDTVTVEVLEKSALGTGFPTDWLIYSLLALAIILAVISILSSVNTKKANSQLRKEIADLLNNEGSKKKQKLNPVDEKKTRKNTKR